MKNKSFNIYTLVFALIALAINLPFMILLIRSAILVGMSNIGNTWEMGLFYPIISIVISLPFFIFSFVVVIISIVKKMVNSLFYIGLVAVILVLAYYIFFLCIFL